MIRCLAVTLALSAAVMVPTRNHGSTTKSTAVRDSNASPLTSVHHTEAHSGYIIASS